MDKRIQSKYKRGVYLNMYKKINNYENYLIYDNGDVLNLNTK
jgi:hypothetical protein